VQRVWRKAQLKPHRLDRYLASDDLEFETKAADIIGLYLDPPQHAVVNRIATPAWYHDRRSRSFSSKSDSMRAPG